MPPPPQLRSRWPKSYVPAGIQLHSQTSEGRRTIMGAKSSGLRSGGQFFDQTVGMKPWVEGRGQGGMNASDDPHWQEPSCRALN